VEIADRRSRPVQMTRGVPQGSPLGPLLFSIYYADVANVCGAHCNFFADDTEMHMFGTSPTEITSLLNDKLNSLRQYLIGNKLELNVSKTVWMLMFGDSQSSEQVHYGGAAIKRVTTFKYLGFVFECNLNWRAHVSAVVAKVRQRLYVLYRSRYCTSRSGRLLLFNALIRPYFEYGIELWFATSKSVRETLELLHRYCLRIVINDLSRIPAISNIGLYKAFGMLPLFLLFQLKVGLIMCKAVKFNTCAPVKVLLNRHDRNRPASTANLRDRGHIAVPLIKREASRACIVFYGAVLWNTLPTGIRETELESTFANEYKAFLMNSLSTAATLCYPSKFYEYV
jgi:hypothetical protein